MGDNWGHRFFKSLKEARLKKENAIKEKYNKEHNELKAKIDGVNYHMAQKHCPIAKDNCFSNCSFYMEGFIFDMTHPITKETIPLPEWPRCKLTRVSDA